MDIKSVTNNTIQAGYTAPLPTNTQTVAPSSLHTKVETPQAVSNIQAVTDSNVEELIKNGQASLQESYTVNRSTFTLFRLPDGKMYSRVRNLDTGEIKYYPSLDNYTYAEALRNNTGTVYEEEI